jgi:hypothetical protein
MRAAFLAHIDRWRIMIGACTKCGTHHGSVMPLHGEWGGPPYCFMCAGAWHAEHAPRRRARRVLIKALKAYEAAGGSLNGEEFDELKIEAGPCIAADSHDNGNIISRPLCSLGPGSTVGH